MFFSSVVNLLELKCIFQCVMVILNTVVIGILQWIIVMPVD